MWEVFCIFGLHDYTHQGPGGFCYGCFRKWEPRPSFWAWFFGWED